jgi:hypothetical protein
MAVVAGADLPVDNHVKTSKVLYETIETLLRIDEGRRRLRRSGETLRWLRTPLDLPSDPYGMCLHLAGVHQHVNSGSVGGREAASKCWINVSGGSELIAVLALDSE